MKNSFCHRGHSLSGIEDGESKAISGRSAGGGFASAFPNFSSDQKTLDKLSERRYVKDFKRILDAADGFRLTSVNASYKLTNRCDLFFQLRCLVFEE